MFLNFIKKVFFNDILKNQVTLKTYKKGVIVLYKIILGQRYYKKEQNEISGYQGINEYLSDYSKKVYMKINDFLLEEIPEDSIKNKESYLISEIIINIHVEGSEKEDTYMDFDEFRNDKNLLSKNKNIQLEFNSEVKLINQDILNIMEILKKSIEKDVKNLLMNNY